jgi:hypothetical protein
MFAAYPTAFAAEDRRLCATDGPPVAPAEAFALRNYAARHRLLENPARIAAILSAYKAAGPSGATESDIAAATRLPLAAVARASLWLLKYHYLQEPSR